MSDEIIEGEIIDHVAVSGTTTYKTQWAKRKRDSFKAEHGYSLRAHYATGGNRQAVLKRDNSSCVRCGMTDEEHKNTWKRPITIDHISKDRKDNRLENLQTLCLRCHGNKDLISKLRQPKLIVHKETVVSMRREGASYKKIADTVGFSIAAVWKWSRIWEGKDV